MQKLKQIYRSSYAGESVVTSLTYENADWTTETEYVPNSVFNAHTTTQAVAIGNGESRLGFDLNHVLNHISGIGGVDSLQTYGCNALYRDYTPDFLVAVGDDIVKEIAYSGYTAKNIVYTNGQHILEYPGMFYLIPQNINYDAGAIAAYMACFDGHKKVFLLGYDSYDEQSPTNNVYKNTSGYPSDEDTHTHEYFTRTLKNVITTYPEVEFVRVMPADTWWMADELQGLPNLRQISFRDFVMEADIGQIATV